MANITGIIQHRIAVHCARAVTKNLAPDTAALRTVMQTVKDPSIFLLGEKGRKVASLAYRDSGQRISVLRDQAGPLVLKYTKQFSGEDFRNDPPHLIATSTNKLLIMKKVNPEAFTRIRDDDVVLCSHPTTEKVGAALLFAIGAPSYFVASGLQYEYLEFLPGIDLNTLYRNEQSTLREIEADEDLLQKAAFSIGIALSQAYVLGARDRRGGIRLDMEMLLNSTYEQIAAGAKQPCFNIDMSSALDMRVFERNAHSFLCVNDLHSFLLNQKVVKEQIALGFVSGFIRIIENFRANQGMASDAIRSLAKEKAEYVLNKLNIPVEQIQQEVNKFLLIDQKSDPSGY